MAVELLTPAGLAVALAAALPLAALGLAARRGARARAAIGLSQLGLRRIAVPAVLIAAVGLLAGLAAAQPVLRTVGDAAVRTDAAVWLVVDTSRSMAASAGPDAPTRLDRARALAFDLRERLGGFPVGVATISDRVLPHLFPSPDRASFAATMTRSVRIGRPTPAGDGLTGTNLTALSGIASQNYFLPAVRRRVAIVLTDADSDPLDAAALEDAFRSQPRTALLLVRVGGPDELVHDARGFPEPGYRTSPEASVLAAQVADAAGGRSYDEDDVIAVTAAARGFLGRDGETALRPGQERRVALAPWAMALAAVPFALLLRRRNVD